MDRKIPIVKKVHLDTFIHLLVELYNKGVEYIDIYQMPIQDDKDVVGISFTEEYMNSEMADNFDELTKMADRVEEEEDDDSSLTDDDLNQLI